MLSEDNSIIDVTGEAFQISTDSHLKKYTDGKVPHWVNLSVYSYSEIYEATSAQIKFYQFFRNNFLNGVYYDVEGNTNYAFILLFDLQKQYIVHKDISKLEKQLEALGQNYPKTKPYSMSFLMDKLVEKSDSEGVSRPVKEQQNEYNAYDYWRLGTRYKSKLNLNEAEVNLLNKLWNPYNNFCGIEFCCIQILKLYLAVFEELKKHYIQTGSTLEKQFLSVADVITRKHFRWRSGNNYKYYMELAINDFYLNIFKHCENAVREYYGHKRKLNTEIYNGSSDAQAEYETKIILKVTEIFPLLISSVVSTPDEKTEIELNIQNTNRWKIKFEVLTNSFKDNSKQFVEAIFSLGKLNNKNPSVENIFYEASKFIATKDKAAALTLYIHYLYHDLQSVTFENKQFTKTIQKNLFSTNEQIRDFETIVSQLIKDKDLNKALNSIPQIYDAKRKKIELNKDLIKDIREKDSGATVILDDVLKDEVGSNPAKSQEICEEKLIIDITAKSETSQETIYTNDIAFTSIQIETLTLFLKCNFSIYQPDFEAFAKEKGLFKNQLINNINEVCYNVIDDNLIEEDDDFYTINKNYYDKILTK